MRECRKTEVQHLGLLFATWEIRLLNENLSRYISSWLPHANDSAIWLNLVDVSSRNPNLLSDVCWLNHYGRRRHHLSWGNHHGLLNHYWSWLRDHNRCRSCDCVCNHPTYDSTHESGPEVATTTTPSAIRMVMVSTANPMDYRSGSRAPKSTRTWATPTRTCKGSAYAHCDDCHYCQFLVHCLASFVLCVFTI